jgi:hypothetical protein
MCNWNKIGKGIVLHIVVHKIPRGMQFAGLICLLFIKFD